MDGLDWLEVADQRRKEARENPRPEHDIAHIDHHHGLVVLVCACGHRSEASTKAQADEKHAGHRGVEQAREALKTRDGAAQDEGGTV